MTMFLSRLLMNLELLKAGYPPSVMTIENRLTHYETLDQWMVYRNGKPFNSLVANVILEGFKPYQMVIGS